MFDSLEFRDPLILIAVLLLPFIYLLASRLPSTVTYSSLTLVDTGHNSWRMRLANLPPLLLTLSCFLLVIAMAGPRTGDETTEIKRDGIAIMLVFDRSGSMDARDFVEKDRSLSRLQVVKDVLHTFIAGDDGHAGRPNDLLGLVTFGTYADGICPLTLDHKNLLNILNDVQIAKESNEGQTAVGEGLGLAVERLRQHPAKSKVIVLLTDGVNNAGEIEPIQAAQLAAKHKIKVYTVGAGTTGFAPFPVQGRDGRTYLQKAQVEIDEDTLKEIAQQTDGRYFHASNAKALQNTYTEIDKLERSEITELRYLQYQEHYSTFILLALCITSLALLASSTLLRRLP